MQRRPQHVRRKSAVVAWTILAGEPTTLPQSHVPGGTTNQRPAHLVDIYGDLAGHRVVMRQPGLGQRKGSEVIVGDSGEHGQRR